MCTRIVILLTLLAGPVMAAATWSEDARHATLGAFVGIWDMDLEADPVTFGERAGPGTGIMTCAWGPGENWVDCDLDSLYEGLGRYYLKIVLYRVGSGKSLGAFVTNSFGGGRLYVGEQRSPERLVYEDAWVDPARKWEYQRTTYTFHAKDRLSFAIEVSQDGKDYLPHSRGDYRRR